MQIFDRFHHVADSPSVYAQQWQARTGAKVVGTLCSYAPEELILAAGALPLRLFAQGETIAAADAHLQAYCCHLVRGVLEEGLQGRLDVLDAVVFPHTCDSIQRLSDIWRLNLKQQLHFDVVLPAKLNTESAFNYLIDVFASFKNQLETGLQVTIDDTALKDSIALCNRMRELLAGLYRIKRESPGAISGHDLYAVVKSAMIMDRREFITLLEELLETVSAEQPAVAFTGRRVILSGGLCNQGDIYSAVEMAGAAVVWDDLCTGARAWDGQIAENGDLLTAIARRYRDRVACPAKHQDLTSRGEALATAVKRYKADGVIIVRLKFCDPHAFDYPYLKGVLDQAGIPVLLIELEHQDGGAGQLSTRLEAFVEML